MKLYDYAGAPNPRRVKIFLAEKGVACDIVNLDLVKGEHKTPEFLEKNPSAKVPVLELDDGRCLGESVAICRYLEALHPKPNLFGNDPYELGFIEMRNRHIELELWSQIGISWRNGPIVGAMGIYKQNAAAKQASDASVREYYIRLDKEFAESNYVAGSRFTVADITLLTAIDFASARVELKPDNSLENLWRWHQLVSDRDSVD